MASNLILENVKKSSYFKNKLDCLSLRKRVFFSGMVGSSSAACIAALAHKYPSLLIISPSTSKAESLKAEIELINGQSCVLFPAPDVVPGEDLAPSKEIIGERLSCLNHWQKGENFVAVAPVKAVMWRVGLGKGIRVSGDQGRGISGSGDQGYREKLIESLVKLGYKRFEIVGEKGEFSVRGGIIDVFPLNSDYPVRIELFGDEISSIRTFDVFNQLTISKLNEVEILPAQDAFEIPLFNLLPKNTLIVFDEMTEIEWSAAGHISEQLSVPSTKKYLSIDEIKLATQAFPVAESSSFILPDEEICFSSPESYINRLEEIPKHAVVVSKHAQRLRHEIEAKVVEGGLRGGFVFADNLLVLSDRELFGETYIRRAVKSRAKEGVNRELLADLAINDYVVHENYGIGIYLGMEKMEVEDGVFVEYMVIAYAGEDKVFVPPSMLGMVEKYSGGNDLSPTLSHLGSNRWQQSKKQVKKALQDMTKELLEIYAARQKFPGYTYPPDDIWQTELEGTFPYDETADQLKAINETKKDMEDGKPMDRLICGDVGYGKTEVAIRAAGKAVAAGKQVAVLVPTTLLAEQHFNNFRNRFSATPFNIEMLSRFKSKKDQLRIVKSLGEGGVDIVIGTHRLLSKDIIFHDLGLLVLDEEQRFGVAHKEKLKKLKKTIDVLTLSATPIPRTLYLSLAGVREMSVINTPPVDRSPIRTYVLPWNEVVIAEAIRREIDRGGQVFLLHNQVESIMGMATKIKRLVPEAKVAVGHGQLDAKQLEKTMLQFLDREYDVLVCTTIIESGLDITNVNTLLVNDAERFGLSQLYQIRGRVGRSAARAYAYLFYQPERIMSGAALERLKAIQEFTALGSGYKLAMRDLEIRGAGNLLGSQQSGHIAEIGFELYCELLEKAVLEAKGINEPMPQEVSIDLKIDAHIPVEYICDDRQRIAVYRRLNLISSAERLEEMRKELKDRFGELPGPLKKLCELVKLKIKALKAGILAIEEKGNIIYFTYQNGKKKYVESSAQDKMRVVEKVICGGQ
ncbi:MAG: transcription-repair coupling factor [Candidatus Margulisiibacteriota bacterium]